MIKIKRIQYILFLGTIFSLLAINLILPEFNVSTQGLNYPKDISEGGRYLGFEPFSGSRITRNYLISVGGYFLLTFLLGYSISSGLFFNQKISFITKLHISIIPGYLATIGINRIVTLILPYKYATEGIIWTLILFTLGLSFLKFKEKRKAIKSLRLTLTESPQKIYSSIFSSIICAIGIWILLLIISIYPATPHYLTGHANNYWLKFIAWDLDINQGINFFQRFPIFSFHYAEVIYNFPLLYSEMGKKVTLFPFWILQVSIKVSGLYFLYFLFKNAHTTKIFAVSASCFIYFGSFLFSPFIYFNYFDSGNPLAFTPAPGRVIASIWPWFLIQYFEGIKSDNKGSAHLQTISIILIALGITGISVHVFLYSLPTLFILLCYRFITFSNIEPSKLQKNTLYFILLTPVLSYGLLAVPTPKISGVLLLSIFILGCYLLLFLPLKSLKVRPENFRNQNKKYYTRMIYLMAVIMIFGSLSLGNMGTLLSNSIWDTLSKQYSFIAPPPLIIKKDPRELTSGEAADVLLKSLENDFNKIEEKGNPTDVANNAKFEFLTIKGCCLGNTKPFNGHQAKSKNRFSPLFYYILMYGVVTIMALVGLLSINKNSHKKSKTLYFYFYLYFITAFVASLFIKDFIYVGHISDWVMIRFIEVPFYSIIILFFLTTARYKTFYPLVLIYSIFWSAIPFFNNYYQQLIINYNYLINTILQ